MEQSVAEYPLALAYRNLAVYWNSEGDLVQGNAYTQKALALDPRDPYNIVFAAVFMPIAVKSTSLTATALSIAPVSYPVENSSALFWRARKL